MLSSVTPWRMILVLVDDGVALAAGDGHRRDLGIEAAGLLRRLGLVLRGDGEAVLVLTGDLPPRAMFSAVWPM